MPGDLSALRNDTGTPTRTRVDAETRRKSTCTGRSLILSYCTSRGNTRSFLPSTSRSMRLVMKLALSNWRTRILSSIAIIAGFCLSP